MRLLRFYKRFRNQYRIHSHWASLWLIIKIAWIQSKHREDPYIKIEEVSIDELFGS